ncbi:MAG: GspH/FimT family pseudopilin [Ramlibacter sp.]|nr:GspH/FimT family pseudopilin [Ramlibacter sp.]
MQKQRGFTLIELLLVLTIAAVLTALAAPSFGRLIKSNAISGGVNTFMGDLRFARSEAIRLGGPVVVCRSDAPEAPSPVCGPNTSALNRNWSSGWIVFQDLNSDGVKNAADPVLRVQAALGTIDAIVEAGTTSDGVLRFTTTGRLLNVTSATQLTFGGGNFATDVRRVVCVSLGGRGRIAGDGATTCGSDNQ